MTESRHESFRARRRALRDRPPGSRVQETFLVQRAEARQAKSGSVYLAIELRDAAGTLDARIFDATPEMADRFAPGEPMRFVGKLEQYRNAPQLVIDSFRRPTKVEWGELVPSSEHDRGSLRDQIAEILATIENPHLAALRDAYWNDSAFMERFERVPAATGSHHAWRGGLLEHVAGSLRLALALCAHFDWLERDLVLLAVFLHDSGKAFAIDEHQGKIEYTTVGRLLGNETLGVTYLDRKLQELGDVPQMLGVKLRHCLLAHRGHAQWGAVQSPMIPEAVVVHHIDALDSVLGAFRDLEAAPGDAAGAASPFRYAPLLRRRVYVEPHEAESEAEPVEPTVVLDEPPPP